MLLERGWHAVRAAARLRRDRAPRAARAAPLRSGCGGCTRARSRRRPPWSRTASTRRSELASVARVVRGVDAASSSCRSASTRCLRAAGSRRRPSTSSRSAPIRTATSSSSLARRRRRCRVVSFRVVTTADRARSLAARRRRTSTVETDLPVRRRCGAVSSARASSRSRCARTATRARRPCSSRRWRSGKPVVVSRTRAIATGYGLVDGENCRLVAPGDAATFERALGDVLARRVAMRGARARARAARSRRAHVGSVRRSDRAPFCATHAAAPRGAPLAPRVSPRRSRCAASSCRVARRPRVGLDEDLVDVTSNAAERACRASRRTPRPRCSS